MIALPRPLVRDLLNMTRKMNRDRTQPDPVIEMIAGRGGLAIHVVGKEVAVRHSTPGRRPEERLLVPVEALADCGGRGEGAVGFRAGRRGRVEVIPDTGSTTVRTYPAPRTARPLPPLPHRLTRCQPELLAALAAAGAAAAGDPEARYVFNRIQLRGRRGEVIASDGKQLYLHGGFKFPWSGDLLVANAHAIAVLAALKLSPVALAHTATHVWIAAGPWSVALAIDAAGKFPDVGELLKRINKIEASELILDPADRDRLLGALPKLPCRRDEHQPVTIDLAGPEVRSQEKAVPYRTLIAFLVEFLPNCRPRWRLV